MINDTKPRIFFKHGYWRVTPMPRHIIHHGLLLEQSLWTKAHVFVQRLNTTKAWQ